MSFYSVYFALYLNAFMLCILNCLVAKMCYINELALPKAEINNCQTLSRWFTVETDALEFQFCFPPLHFSFSSTQTSVIRTVIWVSGVFNIINAESKCWKSLNQMVGFNAGLYWSVPGELCCGWSWLDHSTAWSQRLEVSDGKKGSGR